MKKLLLHLLLHRASASPKLKRKIKIFAALSLVGVFLAGGLLVLASAAVFDYAARNVVSAQSLQQAGQKLTGDQPLLRPGCLGKAQSMLSLTHWLEKPLQKSFLELKQACLTTT